MGRCVCHHGASSTLVVAGSQCTLKVVSVGSVRVCPCFFWLFADLIVFAGSLAVERATGLEVPFCPGRTDAADGSGWSALSPNTDFNATAAQLAAGAALQGLTSAEMVALAGRPRSGTLMRVRWRQGRAPWLCVCARVCAVV